MSLYEQIGAERVAQILRTFYERCFEDVMIGHFFFEKNHEELFRHQLDFATGMLGGPISYQGRPLASIHKSLLIRAPQFARRRQILVETCQEFKLEPELTQAWINLEDKLKPLILKDQSSCRD